MFPFTPHTTTPPGTLFRAVPYTIENNCCGLLQLLIGLRYLVFSGKMHMEGLNLRFFHRQFGILPMVKLPEVWTIKIRNYSNGSTSSYRCIF